MLGTAALGSLALNLLLHIPNVRNEYKFLFTAALALAPLVGLAVEPLGHRLGRLALPLGFAVSVLLGLQVARKVHIKLEAAEPGRPRLETHSFALRLAESEELAAATDAIREGTPSDTILLADRAAIHLATPTQRHLWVPAHQEHGHPGVGPSSEVILLSWHGLDPEWVHVREALRDRLYAAPSSDAARRGALQRIRALGRPLAILLKRGRHTALRGWLRESGLGRPLPVSGSHEVWLVPASQGADREAREDLR